MLYAEGTARGEDRSGLERRVTAGWDLVRERFERDSVWDTSEDGVTVDGGEVHEVRVGGRTVVEMGQLVHGDMTAIETEARRQAKLLFERMGGIIS